MASCPAAKKRASRQKAANNVVQTAPICNLPANIMLQVFNYLNVKTLCTLSTVCRRWYHLVCDRALWKYVDLRLWPLSLRTLKKIVRNRLSDSVLVQSGRVFSSCSGTAYQRLHWDHQKGRKHFTIFAWGDQDEMSKFRNSGLVLLWHEKYSRSMFATKFKIVTSRSFDSSTWLVWGIAMWDVLPKSIAVEPNILHPRWEFRSP